MTSTTLPATASRGWARLLLSGVVTALLLLDGGIKLVPLQPVTDTMRDLGWPTDPATARSLGAVLIAASLLYVVPRTALVGAILLTAYLGGAVATHVRIGNPLLSHTLFPVYVGAAVWLGLWLREPRLRALLGPGEGA